AVDRSVVVADCGAGVGAVHQDAGPAGGRDVRVAGDGGGDVHETCGGVHVNADLAGGDVHAADRDAHRLACAGPEAVGITVEFPDAASHVGDGIVRARGAADRDAGRRPGIEQRIAGGQRVAAAAAVDLVVGEAG